MGWKWKWIGLVLMLQLAVSKAFFPLAGCAQLPQRFLGYNGRCPDLRLATASADNEQPEAGKGEEEKRGDDGKERIIPIFSSGGSPAGTFMSDAMEGPRREMIAKLRELRLADMKNKGGRGMNSVDIVAGIPYDDPQRAARRAKRLAGRGTPGFGSGIPRLNSITAVGRLGQDPELRYFDNGRCGVLNLSLAVVREVSPIERKARGIAYGSEPTDWWQLIIWGREAESVAARAKKGLRVGVQGQLGCDTWIDKEGNSRKKYKIVVDKLTVLETKEEIAARQAEPNVPWNQKKEGDDAGADSQMGSESIKDNDVGGGGVGDASIGGTADGGGGNSVMQVEMMDDVAIERVKDPAGAGAATVSEDWWADVTDAPSTAPSSTSTSTASSTAKQSKAPPARTPSEVEGDDDKREKPRRRRPPPDLPPLPDDGDKPLPPFFSEF